MRITETVIFDTNIIRNTEPRSFLGGRVELQKFSEVAKIVIPDIVLEELKKQKISSLETHKSSFLSNPFHWIKNLSQEETQSFQIESYINVLELSEQIEYSVIRLTDYTVLEKMRELAINKLPPFEKSEKSDKGFKDTYIYFTILEYIKNNPGEKIYVCTKDGRLKEALAKHQNIITVSDFNEFVSVGISTFYDEYFIAKLKDIVDQNISQDSIINFWESMNGNKVILIKVKGDNYVVEVDAGEIIDYKKQSDYIDAIDKLVSSPTFASTHASIKILDEHKSFLSEEEIIKILEASINNSQIRQIIGDEDVKDFVGSLYLNKKEIIGIELEFELEQLLKQIT